MLRGWPRARWWTSALRFWDDFSADGALGPEPAEPGPVGAVCLQRTLAAGCQRGLHVPSELALSEPHAGSLRVGCGRRRGWSTSSATHYCTRFKDAWAVAQYAAVHLDDLEPRTRLFASADAREHDSRRRQGCRHGQPLDARHTNLLPNRGRRVPRLRRAAATRAAAAMATARTSGTTRLPPTTSFPSWPARCVAPRSATRWTTRAACASVNCCPTARSASRRLPPTGRWARS